MYLIYPWLTALPVELAHIKEVYLSRRPQLLYFRWLHYRAGNPVGGCTACQTLWRDFTTCSAPGNISHPSSGVRKSLLIVLNF